jgi:hypothetical protein
MPTFTDPAHDAEEARQALRGLAHATRSIDDPATVYDLLGTISQALASLEQTLHQAGTFHDNLQRHNIRPVVADSPRGGTAASYQVAWELHRAAAMTHQVAAAIDHAHEIESRIAYSMPVAPAPHASSRTTGLSM